MIFKNWLEARISDILTGFGHNSSLIWPKVTHFWSDFETRQLTRRISKIGIDGLKIELQGQTRAEIEALEKTHFMHLLDIDLDYFIIV